MEEKTQVPMTHRPIFTLEEAKDILRSASANLEDAFWGNRIELFSFQDFLTVVEDAAAQLVKELIF